MHYKDQSNALYFIDSGEFAHLLPEGCVQITDADAEALRIASIRPVVPTSLTMAQARIALLNAGYLDAVIAGVSQMPRAAQIKWEFASTVERSDSLTETLAAALGLSSEQLDSLFTAGAAL